MPVTEEAITQGLVLATVLAGFALAASVQIATSSRHRGTPTSVILITYFIAGVLSLCGMWVGVLFFANAGDVEDQQRLFSHFYLILAIGAAVFALASLITVWTYANRLEAVICTLVFVIVAVYAAYLFFDTL
jgi:hypothetical protein